LQKNEGRVQSADSSKTSADPELLMVHRFIITLF